MSKWEDLLQGIVHNAGVAGVRELEDALESVEKDAKEPWKKAILQLAGDAVEQYGPEGLKHVERLIDRIGDDDEPDMEFASLRARSDYLAALQNMEAEQKSAAKDFFKAMGQKLGIILKGILAGLTG